MRLVLGGRPRRLRGAPKPPHAAGGPGNRKVVGCLQVEPELRCCAEGLRQKPRRFGCDTTPPADEFIDSLERYAEVLGQCDLCEPQRSEELLTQDLARVGRNSVTGLHS